MSLRPCKQIQLGAQFPLLYLFHFSTRFGHPCAYHQEEITVCHSIWLASSLLVGWKSNQQTRRQTYKS